VIGARGVVVAAATWVGEGVVGVVYLLESLGAGGALGGIGGDAVGVVFECGSVDGRLVDGGMSGLGTSYFL
jgi:hypothetical protein